MDIANFAVAFVAMIAACVAAYFSFRGPSKADIERVERNTAKTAEQVEAVRTHVAQVDDSLLHQKRREELDSEASQVPIALSGQDFADKPLTLRIVLGSSKFTLEKIELVNDKNLFSGASECTRTEGDSYTAVLLPDNIARWFNSGIPQRYGQLHAASVRALFRRGAERSERTFSVLIHSDFRQRLGSTSVYYLINGEC